jgi:hypothetical protein
VELIIKKGKEKGGKEKEKEGESAPLKRPLSRHRLSTRQSWTVGQKKND